MKELRYYLLSQSLCKNKFSSVNLLMIYKIYYESKIKSQSIIHRNFRTFKFLQSNLLTCKEKEYSTDTINQRIKVLFAT